LTRRVLILLFAKGHNTNPIVQMCAPALIALTTNLGIALALKNCSFDRAKTLLKIYDSLNDFQLNILCLTSSDLVYFLKHKI
jgi:hypothetical protein